MGVQVLVIPVPAWPKGFDTYAFTQGQTGQGMAQVVKTDPLSGRLSRSFRRKARVAVVRHERISVRRPNTKSLRQADISCTDNFIIFKKQSKACCGSKTARDFLNLGGVISNVAPPNTITRATTWFKRSLICAGWQFGIHYRGQRIPKRPNPWEEAECRT